MKSLWIGTLIALFLGFASVAQARPSACPSGTDAVVASSLTVEAGKARGTFSIAAGCEDVEVSLASYAASGPTFPDNFPQTLFDSATGHFDAGGPFELEADLAPCFFQVDLVVGPVITNLTPDNLYGERRLRAKTGGQACVELPPSGGVPSPTVAAAEQPAVDLAIVKTVSPLQVQVGDALTYVKTVVNNGSGTATNVTVSDDLPVEITLVSAAASQGSCTGVDPLLCNLGTLAPGASATITFVATGAIPGTAVNRATVAANEPDTNPADNAADATAEIVAAPLRPRSICGSLRVGIKSLAVGKRTALRIAVRDQRGKPMARVRINLRGAGIRTSARTGKGGVARLALVPRKPGILRISAVGSARCAQRIGVLGAFQPPVTG